MNLVDLPVNVAVSTMQMDLFFPNIDQQLSIVCSNLESIILLLIHYIYFNGRGKVIGSPSL
jgi:hypothetical protein